MNKTFYFLTLIILIALIAIAAVWFLTKNGEISDIQNVIIISIDTCRADYLSCYGYPEKITPNIDALANEASLFKNTVSPVPITLPAHCSLLTGTNPPYHGVRSNVAYKLAPSNLTMAEILKSNGFQTAAIVSTFVLEKQFGLSQGFDTYDDEYQEIHSSRFGNERKGDEATRIALEYLENNNDRKSFLFLHYYDPHLPYDPPSPYREEAPGRPYDGEIAYMDRYVGAIRDALEERGLLDETLVVVAGDHGEGLGDKVERGHGIFLYEETLRVPLLLFDREVFRRPLVVESAVRLIDVAPTVLELLGLEREAAGMQGKSLVPWIRGRSAGDLDALVETFYPRENFGWSELVGWISQGWKLLQSPRPELFDLRADPGERTDLFGTEAAKARELAEGLEQEILRLGRGPDASGGAAPGRAEDRERLRSLGYVNLAPATPGAAAPDPKDRIALLELIQQAQSLESEQRFAEAERVHLDILKEIPDSPEAYVNLAIVQARQNAFDRAIDTLLRGTDRLPDSVALVVRLGHTYLVSGKPLKALEAMDRALVLDPRNVDALTVRAGILDAAGRKDERMSAG